MMLDSLRLYLRYLSISLRGQLQYRANFILQSLGHLLVTAIEFLGIWAMFDRFGNLRGWTLSEVALIYGMISISFAISDALSRGFDWFGQTVRNGDFDRILLRPRSTVLQISGQEVTLKRAGRLIQGIAILVYAISALDVRWNLAKAVLLLAAIAGGACMFMGLVIIQATM